MKKHLLSVVAFLFAVAVSAQSDSTQVSADSVLVNPKAIPHTQSMHSAKLSVATMPAGWLLPEFSYTKAFGKKHTVGLNLGFSYGKTNYYLFREVNKSSFSVITVDYRFNYSILKRAKKNKTTNCNSSNYVGALVINETLLGQKTVDFSQTFFMLQFGFQRSLFKSNLYVNGNIGYGIKYVNVEFENYSKFRQNGNYSYWLIDARASFSLGYKF